MADEIKLDILVTIPPSIEPSGDMPDRWVEGLTNNAQRMHDRIVEILPDDGEYQSKVAEPGNQKWGPMVAPGFVAKSGRSASNIRQAHYKGLTNAYAKFREHLDQAFETIDGVVAKLFKGKVNAAKDRWANGVAKGLLRITGDRIRGLIVPQVTYWMTGDARANRMTNHMEVVNGGPYDFTKTGLRQQFKSAVTSLLVITGISIIKADMEATELAAQNTRLTDLANSFKAATVKPFVVGGTATDSVLQYESDVNSGALKLRARIVLI